MRREPMSSAREAKALMLAVGAALAMTTTAAQATGVVVATSGLRRANIRSDTRSGTMSVSCSPPAIR
jgi:hypothetical protein